MTESLVEQVEEVEANLRTLARFSSGTAEERRFFAGRIKNGKHFVGMPVDGTWLFSPSKFAGYKDNGLIHMALIGERHGRDTNRRLTALLGVALTPNLTAYGAIDRAFLDYCDEHGIIPSVHQTARTYWLMQTSAGLSQGDETADETLEEGLPEGACAKVLVNRYERSREARRRCLEAHGTDCSVCAMSFSDQYGEIGVGFIHVHHVTPVAQVGVEYRVDPVRDLIPICPNCHAMVHKRNPPFSVAELKARLTKPRAQ